MPGLTADVLEYGERLRQGAEGQDGDEGENDHVRHLKISVGMMTMPVMFHSHAAHRSVCFIGDNSADGSLGGQSGRPGQDRLSSRLRLATTLRL